jgi:hypothetical protein
LQPDNGVVLGATIHVVKINGGSFTKNYSKFLLAHEPTPLIRVFWQSVAFTGQYRYKNVIDCRSPHKFGRPPGPYKGIFAAHARGFLS